MKKLVILFLIFLFLKDVQAQEYVIQLEPKAETVSIDSIHVANIAKGLTVKLNPGETITLTSTPGTSSNEIMLNETETGCLYPNPFNESAILSFITKQRQDITINVYNAAGQSILLYRQNLLPGNHRFQLLLPTPGLYQIIILKRARKLNFKAVYNGENNQNAELQYLGNDNFTIDVIHSNKLKNAQSDKTLYFSAGDVIHYTVFSENNITVIPDSPIGSKTIEVEFYECKDNDERNYKTVKIGEQIWMAENLAYLPSVSYSPQGSATSPYYYVYGYQGIDVGEAKSTDNYKTYGALYNWPAVMGDTSSNSAKTGVCPTGWHLPSDSEWTQLMNFLIANGHNYDGTTTENKIAKSLAASAYWAINSEPGAIGNNLSANNSSGFYALPGGHRYNTYFSGITSFGSWWTSTEAPDPLIFRRMLNSNNSYINRTAGGKDQGFSVRCVLD